MFLLFRLICIHMISWLLLLFSRSSISCELCFRSLQIVMATPPPSPSPLGMWYHCAYSQSADRVPFVSVIATMWLFWLSVAACRLMILPLVPFIFAYSILIWLWFSFFPFSDFFPVVGGSFLVVISLGAVFGRYWVVERILVLPFEWATAPILTAVLFAGPVFCLLLGVSPGCDRPITGQVTSVTWPVIGWA